MGSFTFVLAAVTVFCVPLLVASQHSCGCANEKTCIDLKMYQMEEDFKAQCEQKCNEHLGQYQDKFAACQTGGRSQINDVADGTGEGKQQPQKGRKGSNKGRGKGRGMKALFNKLPQEVKDYKRCMKCCFEEGYKQEEPEKLVVTLYYGADLKDSDDNEQAIQDWLADLEISEEQVEQIEIQDNSSVQITFSPSLMLTKDEMAEELEVAEEREEPAMLESSSGVDVSAQAWKVELMGPEPMAVPNQETKSQKLIVTLHYNESARNNKANRDAIETWLANIEIGEQDFEKIKVRGSDVVITMSSSLMLTTTEMEEQLDAAAERETPASLVSNSGADMNATSWDVELMSPRVSKNKNKGKPSSFEACQSRRNPIMDKRGDLLSAEQVETIVEDCIKETGCVDQNNFASAFSELCKPLPEVEEATRQAAVEEKVGKCECLSEQGVDGLDCEALESYLQRGDGKHRGAKRSGAQ